MNQLELFAGPRLVLCHACKSGQHIDHHAGIWRKANPVPLALEPDGVRCPCERCEP